MIWCIVIGLEENIITRFCKEKKEIPVHMLYHCEGVARPKFLALGLENSTAYKYIKKLLS